MISYMDTEKVDSKQKWEKIITNQIYTREFPKTLKLLVLDISGNMSLNKEIGRLPVQEVIESSDPFHPPQFQEKTGNLFSG